MGRVEEGEPNGPSAADEATTYEGEEIPQLPPEMAPVRETPSRRLPPLDSLIGRMPAATRSAIDDHLRARFVRVRKLDRGELR